MLSVFIEIFNDICACVCVICIFNCIARTLDLQFLFGLVALCFSTMQTFSLLAMSTRLQIRNKETGKCLDTMGRKTGENVGLLNCHGQGGNQVRLPVWYLLPVSTS